MKWVILTIRDRGMLNRARRTRNAASHRREQRSDVRGRIKCPRRLLSVVPEMFDLVAAATSVPRHMLTGESRP